MVAIFPVVGYTGVAQDESDQFGEARLGANIVRQDDDATLTGLDADHAVCGLTVVAAFVEDVALWAFEDTQSRSETSPQEQPPALLSPSISPVATASRASS